MDSYDSYEFLEIQLTRFQHISNIHLWNALISRFEG